MKRVLMLILAGILFLSACGPERTDIEVHDYWARTALKDGNSAVYMLLHNYTEADDELISVSSDVAIAAEMHLSKMSADGVMQMTQQESILLPVNADVELEPGGYHIMLIGLKQDLNAGDEIAVILHFKNYADIKLTVPVMDAENMDHSGMDDMH